MNNETRIPHRILSILKLSRELHARTTTTRNFIEIQTTSNYIIFRMYPHSENKAFKRSKVTTSRSGPAAGSGKKVTIFNIHIAEEMLV